MIGFLKFIGACVLIFAGFFAYLVVNNPQSTKIEKNTAAQTQARAGQQHTVYMYSLTRCGYCTRKRQQLKKAGIRFQEYFIDKDSAARTRVTQKMAKAGYPGGRIGTPLFEINGKMIPGNPPLETLAEHW